MNLLSAPTLAAAGPAADGSIAEAVTLMIVGMAVVFASLTVLLGVVLIINKLTYQPPAPPPAPRPVAKADDHLVVVLAAAATAAIGQPVEVTNVTPVDG